MRRRDQREWNSGFTFVETLAAVAVLVILLGLGSVAAAYYRDYLRITELDNAAREIYMAAQHRAVLLSGNQRLGGLVEDEAAAVQLSATADGTGKAYYVSSDDMSSALLEAGSIDPALWDGHFYVVYESVSGSVTDVFYAEESIGTLMGSGFQDFYDEWVAAERSERMRSRPMLGYYGGGMAEGAESSRLPTPDVTVLIRNEEKLTLEVVFRVPTSASAIPGLKMKREVKLRYGDASLSLLDGLPVGGRTPTQKTTFIGGKTVTTYTWVLDSLAEGEGQFKDLFGGAGTYGGDFTASASIRLSATGRRPGRASDDDTSNSLFDKGSAGNTANIRFLRHLQNLDSGFSGAGGKTGAVQTDRIWCAGNETYPGYEFRPIQNSGLNAYDGGEKEIYDLLVTPESAGGKPVGLFSDISGSSGRRFTFEDVRLVNASADAGATGVAGALAGTADYADFKNCRIYWETTEEHPDLRELLGSDEEGSAYRYRIRGAVAGGLAGRLSGASTITGSFAATLVEGQNTAGGLLGTAGGTLDVSNSYADCYLSGKNAAGLIGCLEADANLKNCYAAGFIYATEKAAGLCLGTDGKTWTDNVYSAVCYPAAGEDRALIYGLTEMQGSVNEGGLMNTFYLKTSGQEPGGEAWARDYADMTDRTKTFKDDLGSAFEWKTARDTRPYNLREHLNLVNYSFPGLAGMDHCGDWGAQFQEPSLVYYEEYDTANPGERYGFSGGNARYLTGIGRLDNRWTILSDGYAVALLQSDLKDVKGGITVIYQDAGGQTVASAQYQKDGLIGATWKNDEGSEADYYLLPLPEAMVNWDKSGDRRPSVNFFQYLKYELQAEGIASVTGEYFYNPHFAETVIPYLPEETAEDDASVWDAGAADRYAGEELVEKGRRNTVSIRTPRHLYDLSLYPEYYSNKAHSYSFRQELHLDYDTYTGYGLFTGQRPFRQSPIGSWNEPFHGVYDGGCRRIRGVIFSVPKDGGRFYAGLFGYSAGTLRDIVYRMDPGQAVTVDMNNGSKSLYVGALAGGNGGTILNCAVSGVNLTGDSYGSTIYVGGLVGQNSGEIRNSAAESVSLSADCSTYGSAYVGGLAGRNDAGRTVAGSYAVGKLTAVVDKNSGARVCGFVGFNAGSIRNSYAAADLESTGQQVETYGFCGMRSGTQMNTCYLNQGNFTYRETSFAANYHREGDTAAETKYADLIKKQFAGMAKAEKTEDGNPGGDLFPYPTGVVNADNRPIHYGQWPVLMDLGEMGIYYWEELEIGGKSRFNISALAVDPAEKTVSGRSNLSAAHDDGGVVTNYGYGYYTRKDVPLTGLSTDVYYSFDGGEGENLEELFKRDGSHTEHEEEHVNEALAELNRGEEEKNEVYEFYSWRTFGLDREGGLYPHDAKAGSPNATITLTQGSRPNRVQVEFTLNPLFAGAMSVKPPAGWRAEDGAHITGSAPPGSAGNVYGVRSIEQLQFINWNSRNRNTGTRIESGTDVSRFPYLSNSNTTGNYYWTQSHDIMGRENAGGSRRYYTPIAEYYDVTTGKTGNLNGWFGGTYDGADYVIENVNIKGQQSSCAGLFGIVYNGMLKNIILFSGEVVSYRNENGQTNSCWYAIGGLAGLAAADGESAIQNCSVAGYRIDADIKMREGGDQNWGGAEIGGLVGISYMNMEKCTADTTIVLSGTVRSVDNIRIGGLTGASQRTITNSYAGGEIKVNRLTASANLAGSIYIGGIVGGSYFKPLNPSGGTMIGTEASDTRGNINNTTNNALTNCYSYVVLPEAKADGRGKIQSLYALGGTGEISSKAEAEANWDNKANHGVCTITNCYYLESQALKNNTGGISGIKTDLGDSAAVSVSYRQLAGKDAIGGRTIYQRLNNFAGTDGEAREAGPFRPVKTRVGENDVAGKYSYPPADRPELQGTNYPFPTILTRGSEKFHVHYGAWPLNGIRRETGGAPIALDLYTKTEHSEVLKLEGVEPGGAWEVTTADGTIASGTIAPGGRLTVRAAGEGTTKLTVTYTRGGITDSLDITVNVTAYLELRPGATAMFPGSRVELAMTPRGRTPVTAGGNTEYRDLPAGELRLASVSSGSDLIHAEKAEENGARVLLTAEAGTPASETPFMVNLGYTYTYKDTESPHALAVTVLALPEAVWQDDTCTVDFSGGFGGYRVEVLTVSLPEGTDSGVTVDVEGGVITLKGVPASQAVPELTITLNVTPTGDEPQPGQEPEPVHTVVMLPVRPPAEETVDQDRFP